VTPIFILFGLFKKS